MRLSRTQRTAAVALLAAVTVGSIAGCSSRRQIDPAATGSWNIEGTSWYAFCDGPNAFIWIPSRNDTDPDELEAVIYDHPNCVTETVPADGTTRPDTDPDGLIDDEEN